MPSLNGFIEYRSSEFTVRSTSQPFVPTNSQPSLNQCTKECSPVLLSNVAFFTETQTFRAESQIGIYSCLQTLVVELDGDQLFEKELGSRLNPFTRGNRYVPCRTVGKPSPT